MNLQEAINSCTRRTDAGGKYFPFADEAILAKQYSCTKKKVLIESCLLGIMPERFLRNYSTYNEKEQATLLGSTVCVVGMGGLGGFLLEMLVRVGIGAIICADGDSFEASNLNRQIFSKENLIGRVKATQGALHLEGISSITEIRVMEEFLCADTLKPLLDSVDIVADALGGLQDKQMLVETAHSSGVPLVVSSIAGKCGYVSYIPLGENAPTSWLGIGSSIEAELGNVPQTVCFATAIMAEYIISYLLGKDKTAHSYIFDLENIAVQSVIF